MKKTRKQVETSGLQAITTRFAGPTESRGARIIASAESGARITVSWDDALGVGDNHSAAAEALARREGWMTDGMRLVGGSTASGYAFVFVERV